MQVRAVSAKDQAQVGRDERWVGCVAVGAGSIARHRLDLLQEVAERSFLFLACVVMMSHQNVQLHVSIKWQR